jgi:hypothetical protein
VVIVILSIAWTVGGTNIELIWNEVDDDVFMGKELLIVIILVEGEFP